MLLQEIYKDDPWKLLVCCILLNQTKRINVDTIREEFFKTYNNPELLANADITELRDLIKKLGFGNIRSTRLISFSKEWIELNKTYYDHSMILTLKGIGKYAYDSYMMFVENDLTVEPTDKELIRYLDNLK